MSYILEALKKSEKERKRGTVPDLLTVQDVPVTEKRSRPLWPYLLLAALLLNAGILMIWIYPWQTEKKEAVEPATFTQQIQTAAFELQQGERVSQRDVSDANLPASAPSQIPAEKSRRGITESLIEPEPQPAIIVNPPSLDVVKDGNQKQYREAKGEDVIENDAVNIAALKDEKQVLHDTSAIKPPVAQEISSALENTKPLSDSDLKKEQKIYNLKELPLSVQKSLPELTISAYLFGYEPESRMVRINDRMLREGQEVIEGLKIEQITSNGVIFSYEEYRFRMELF